MGPFILVLSLEVNLIHQSHELTKQLFLQKNSIES